MIQVFEKKDSCCGCTACFSSCSVNAISMVADECGFIYPVVDQIKCNNCRMCVDVCRFAKPENTRFEFENPICYAVKHKNMDVIEKSRSAGAFTAISDFILNIGGVVYGSSMDSDFIVRHHRAVSKVERDCFRKSKYVQSELGDVFLQVLNDLKTGNKVLFTGTPCQCDGLLSCLKNKPPILLSNLYLCDIVCDGVPSPLVYREYRDWLESKFEGKLEKFEFRNKDKYPWWTCVEKIVINGKHHFMDWYGNLFMDSYTIRPSCFSCKYSKIHHSSDITLGDFWGVEKVYPDLFDRLGCSLVMIHSQKGKGLYNQIINELNSFEVDSCNVLQPRLLTPPLKPKKYEVFWELFLEKGINQAISKFGRNTLLVRFKFRSLVKTILLLPFRVLKKIFKIISKIVMVREA